MNKWPIVITTSLWPYTIMNVCNSLNDTSSKHRDKTRIELFTKTHMKPNLSHHHHIGNPVYVLERKLATGTPWQWWWARARVGIYHGKSPSHARSVSLALNPHIGMVSPQFHLKYDDMFKIIQGRRHMVFGISSVIFLIIHDQLRHQGYSKTMRQSPERTRKR
jgi:hypothetical protein